MSESIVKQIAGLHRLNSVQLKQRWRDLFGTEAPAYNRAFLIKRLAYRLQELTHGGLSAATQAKMKDILRGAGLTEDGLTPGTGRSKKRTPNRPILGTRLVARGAVTATRSPSSRAATSTRDDATAR